MARKLYIFRDSSWLDPGAVKRGLNTVNRSSSISSAFCLTAWSRRFAELIIYEYLRDTNFLYSLPPPLPNLCFSLSFWWFLVSSSTSWNYSFLLALFTIDRFRASQKVNLTKIITKPVRRNSVMNCSAIEILSATFQKSRIENIRIEVEEQIKSSKKDSIRIVNVKWMQVIGLIMSLIFSCIRCFEFLMNSLKQLGVCFTVLFIASSVAS